MKNRALKLFSVLLAVCLLLTAAPLAGFAKIELPELKLPGLPSVFSKAATVVDSGTCGENLTWTLDSDGLLTVSGTGQMGDYSYYDPSPFFERSDIKKLVIKTGVTSIGDSAFAGCTGLTSVTIPDSVMSVGYEAFRGCTGLTSVTIPDGVTIIGANTFSDCTGLTSVMIPDSVKNIGSFAFSGCTGLTSVTIPDSVTSIEVGVFFFCSGLKSVTIPESVTSIEGNAFYYCTGLTSVTIPNSVTSIDDSVFAGCTGLTGVTIPDSVTSIGTHAFDGCTGLTSVAIPDSVTTIGMYAFDRCTGLTSVTIPDSVTSIGVAAFAGCTGLTSIVVASGNKTYRSAGNCLIETESKTLIAGCNTSVIPTDGSVKNIGSFAFSGCTGLTSVTIPDSVKNIGRSAFSGCTGLTSITIPDSVTSIGLYAFSGCTGLTSVTIPGSVTSIGDYAFYGCTGLSSVMIPPTVTEIGWGAIPAHTVIYGAPGSYAQEWAEENDRAFLPIGDAAVTLTAPATVNEAAVPATGYANPGAEVVLTVNGKAAATAKASANGKWTANVPLTGAKDGDAFTLKAAVTLDGKTAEKTASVAYKPAAILPLSFTMAHNLYTAEIRGGVMTAAVRNFTVVPGKPFSFRAQVSNNDRVKELSVVSAKGKERKTLPLAYVSDIGCWVGAGSFDADPNYVPGVLTLEGTDKDGAAFVAGAEMKFNFLVDPSGYAYAAVKTNVLSGVTAAIYYKDAAGHELLWDADAANQFNPVETLADGAFSWVVPEGQWQVRLYKDGYQDAASDWMDVPPEHTNVYVPMLPDTAPTVESATVTADAAELTFSTYMEIGSVNAETVKIEGYTGKVAPVDRTETEKGSGVFYARTFRFTPEKKLGGKVVLTVSGAKDFAGNEMEEDFRTEAAVAAAPKDLTAPKEVSLACGQTAELTVAAENAAGKTVTVQSDSAILTLPENALTLDETGKATLTVTAALPGTAALTFRLEGTRLTAQMAVTVENPGGAAEDPAGVAYKPGDVDGNGEIEVTDARYALRAAVGLENYEPGSAQFLAADTDGNGEIEVSDARNILRAAVGLDDPADWKTA